MRAMKNLVPFVEVGCSCFRHHPIFYLCNLRSVVCIAKQNRQHY